MGYQPTRLHTSIQGLMDEGSGSCSCTIWNTCSLAKEERGGETPHVLIASAQKWHISLPLIILWLKLVISAQLNSKEVWER